MAKTQSTYKKRCSNLRRLISDDSLFCVGPFVKMHRRDMTYIWNSNTDNVILKWRVHRGMLVSQYRAASLYKPVLERAHKKIRKDDRLIRISIASDRMAKNRSAVMALLGR